MLGTDAAGGGASTVEVLELLARKTEIPRTPAKINRLTPFFNPAMT